MVSAAVFARNIMLGSHGESRIRSNPPSSRSLMKIRLIASRDANSRVVTSTPAAIPPSSRSRSSANRKITNTVAEKSAIGASERHARSSIFRSLPSIASKPLIRAPRSDRR